MELTNPRMTIQNTLGPEQLVTVEHAFGEHEKLVFTVITPKASRDMLLTERAAVARLKYLLGLLEASLSNAPADPNPGPR